MYGVTLPQGFDINKYFISLLLFLGIFPFSYIYRSDILQKDNDKVIDFEAEKGADDIDAKGVDPISKLTDYIPPCKGKMKVTNDPNVEKFLIHMPLLPESITFEGMYLAQIPHLKIEHWDLADHERFPHLTTENYMKRFYYKELGVIVLELVEWIHEVNQSGLLNLLWVPHYHHSNINIICIKKLLTMVHNECLWLSMPIPIMDIVIPRITLLPHSGFTPAKEFGGKTSECNLAEKMKKKFDLVKNLCG